MLTAQVQITPNGDSHVVEVSVGRLRRFSIFVLVTLGAGVTAVVLFHTARLLETTLPGWALGTLLYGSVGAIGVGAMLAGLTLSMLVGGLMQPKAWRMTLSPDALTIGRRTIRRAAIQRLSADGGARMPFATDVVLVHDDGRLLLASHLSRREATTLVRQLATLLDLAQPATP